MKAEFDKAMNALLLEVDESIVENIRKIGHEYAAEVSRERAIQYKDWILKHYGYSDISFEVPDSSYEDFDFEFPFKEQEEQQ